MTRTVPRAVLAALAGLVGLAGLVSLALAGAGCDGASAYRCASSSQCVAGGQQGTCADGFCAFADPSCPAGMRYEANAGDGLGGTCVAGDAACGVVGQACCGLEGAACREQLFCNSGTCASCVGDLVLGRRFSCVLTHDHTVQCAGQNVKGQLGFGIAGVPSATRMQVRDSTGNPIADATAIGAGREHACAVRANGSVWCWGANEKGQLGNNASLTTPPPPQAAAVAVVTSNGTPLTNIVEVGGGEDYTCARDGGGGAWCWGNNVRGTLGDGSITARSTAARVLDAGGAALTGALGLQVGSGMACVRKADDVVWCWGRNVEGQFGDGTLSNHTSPVKLATTTSLALGQWHTCYVEADTTITCSGWNGHARLGLGTGAGYSDGNHTAKEKVLSAIGGGPLSGAAKIAAGGVSCALMRDTGVYCWGDDHYGQTGTGQGEVVPTKVRAVDGAPLVGVERLVVEYAHVCAFKASGEILCWGRNNDGDLGDGTFVNRGFPTTIESACR